MRIKFILIHIRTLVNNYNKEMINNANIDII